MTVHPVVRAFLRAKAEDPDTYVVTIGAGDLLDLLNEAGAKARAEALPDEVLAAHDAWYSPEGEAATSSPYRMQLALAAARKIRLTR